MTNLECVNAVLRAVGISPVGTVETTGPSDAAEAWRHLEQAEREIQAKGWSYNRRFDIEIEPDGDGHLNIPSDVFSDSIDSYGASSSIDLVPYGSRLYDRVNNTDVFADSVRVQYILRFELCSIPEAVQQYIVKAAAAAFARYLDARGRRTTSFIMLERDMHKARAHALRSDTAVTDQNLSADRTAVRFIGRPMDGYGAYGGSWRVEL